MSKKRKKDQISGYLKRGKIEQKPTCDHDASFTPMASCITDLPVIKHKLTHCHKNNSFII